MAYVDLMPAIHKSTKSDYFARVKELDFSKSKAAELTKKWGFVYRDADRKICYGFQRPRFLSQIFAFAGALAHPYFAIARARVSHSCGGNGFHRHSLNQQTQVGFYNIAVGDTTNIYPEFAVNASNDCQAVQVLLGQGQFSIGCEVVRQLFYKKVCHVKLTLRVATTWG